MPEFPLPPFASRSATAERILATKDVVAATVTEEFLRCHPDLLIRYGEAGRNRGIEDVRHHIEFLAAAIETGSVAAFCEYARWCRRLLGGIGIAPHLLAEHLLQIADSLAAKLPSGCGKTIDAFTRCAVKACLETPDDESLAPADSRLAGARSVFVQAILMARRREALAIAREALREGHATMDVYTHVFQDALYEIGHRWQVGQITVAQEHMATATVQYVIAQIYSELPLAANSRGRAVVTGVQGEFHQVGANIVADMLEADGWNVQFLGTNMPHSAIVAAVSGGEIKLLGISATMLFNLPHVRALVLEVREKLGDRAPRIVVGGGAFRRCDGFCAELGVEGPAADLRAAVELCAA